MRCVPVLHGLGERLRQVAGEFAKFGTVGAINTVVNYVVFNALILTVFVHGPLKANVVATVVATTISYVLNRHWTYRDRPRSALHREYALFFVFNLCGLLIELGALGLAKYGLGLTSLFAINIAKTVGLALGTLFRFWAYRTYVFPAAPAAGDATVPVAELAEVELAQLVGSGSTEPISTPDDFAELTASLDEELAARRR